MIEDPLEIGRKTKRT